MTGWWHRVVHWFGWNSGQVVSAVDKRGTIWIGYQCCQCGRVSGIHASYRDAPRPDQFRP